MESGVKIPEQNSSPQTYSHMYSETPSRKLSSLELVAKGIRYFKALCEDAQPGLNDIETAFLNHHKK